MGTIMLTGVGELDYELADATVRLVDVRPAQGWGYRIDEERAGEIEVEFRHDTDGREVEIELELDPRKLEIDVEYERGTPEGMQTLAAEVGEVDYEVAGGALRILEVRPADGWGHVVDEAEPDEFEIEFRHDDGRRIDVEVELDLD